MNEAVHSKFPQFKHSPMCYLLGTLTNRHAKARHPKTPNASKHEALYEGVLWHLQELCERRGVPFDVDGNVPDMVRKLSGTLRSDSWTWEWLISSYERANPGALEDPLMFAAVAFARGRICSMFIDEQREKRLNELRVKEILRRQRHCAERAQNGGDVDFFNSAAWQRLRYEVLSESDGKCCLCGRCYREDGVALEVDHIKPRSRFPNLSLEKSNLQVLCFDCNRGKGNRDITDWRSSKAA